jgi:hypothetical protein
MRLLIAIGLDEPLADRLRDALEARVVVYPAVPALYALDGALRVESARVAGRWLVPDGIVFYSYFDGVRDARRALALADVPTFPDVRATLPLDDKVLALIAARRADGGPDVPRGFLPPGTSVQFEGERVLKWGDRHCGEGKARAQGEFEAREGTVVEPFLHGRSERVLLVGEQAWQLRYESDDWRKNVRARVSEVVPADGALVARARRAAAALGLAVAGFDYVVNDEGAVLLEVNAYPGLDDVPAAQTAFIELVRQWWDTLAR